MKFTEHNFLVQAVFLRFGRKYALPLIDKYTSCPTTIKKHNQLLIAFMPETDFFDHDVFEPFQNCRQFQAFKGAFFTSKFDLIFKLISLEQTLKQVQNYGIDILESWTEFFQDRSYREPSHITMRNIEWEAYLSLHHYIETKKIIL